MSDPICKLRRVHFTDRLSGLARRAYALFTKPVEDADDSHNDNAEDVWIGGGVTLMELVTWNGDGTLTCQPIGGGDSVTVAVQPELWQIPSQRIDTEEWSYDYTNYDNQRRVASCSGVADENQVIVPRFLEGDVLPVWVCPDTLIEGVTLMAITGREWAKEEVP
jgi:hypothetical protein